MPEPLKSAFLFYNNASNDAKEQQTVSTVHWDIRIFDVDAFPLTWNTDLKFILLYPTRKQSNTKKTQTQHPKKTTSKQNTPNPPKHPPPKKNQTNKHNKKNMPT